MIARSFDFFGVGAYQVIITHSFSITFFSDFIDGSRFSFCFAKHLKWFLMDRQSELLMYHSIFKFHFKSTMMIWFVSIMEVIVIILTAWTGWSKIISRILRFWFLMISLTLWSEHLPSKLTSFKAFPKNTLF